MASVSCPNCGRPIGVEYSSTEAGKCQLWRVMNEGHNRIEPRTIADCFGYTSRRIRELQAALTETTERANAAQASLRRHHNKTQRATVTEEKPRDMFPDDARIETS